MTSLYKGLAYLICFLVAVQAGVHAWASAGLVQFIAGGGTLDMSPGAAPPDLPEFLGIVIHGMNGMYVIPLVSLALLAVGFASRVPGAVQRAAIVFALVVVQVFLGFMGHSVTLLSLLHGLNALALFAGAFLAAQVVARAVPARVPARATAGVH